MKSAYMSAILALTLGCSSEAAGALEVPAVLKAKAPEIEAIQQRLDPLGRAAVIVEFALSGQTSVQLDTPANVAALKSRVNLVRRRVLGRVFGSDPDGRLSASPREIVPMTLSPMVSFTGSLEDIARIAADPEVVRIHADAFFEPVLQDSVPLIGMGPVHSAGGTGKNTVVVVLDGPVQTNHVFLRTRPGDPPRVLAEACFSNNGREAPSPASLCPNKKGFQEGPGSASFCPDFERCDHATGVAGIIGGSWNGSLPRRGVAPQVRFVFIQVLTKLPDGSLQAHRGDLIRALNYVAELATEIPAGLRGAAINISLSEKDSLHEEDCDSNPVAGFIGSMTYPVVVAAGNDGARDAVGVPGCASFAITVASTMKGDRFAPLTNYGELVDFLAPGEAITTSRASQTANLFGSSTGGAGGTSFAAPHVTGAIAALRSKFPTKPFRIILRALDVTGVKLTETRSPPSFRPPVRPRINVADALTMLQSNSPWIQMPDHHFATQPGTGNWPEDQIIYLRCEVPSMQFTVLADRRARWTVSLPTGWRFTRDTSNPDGNPVDWSVRVRRTKRENTIGSFSLRVNFVIQNGFGSSFQVMPYRVVRRPAPDPYDANCIYRPS